MTDKRYALIGPVRFAFATLDEPKAVMQGGRPTGNPFYSVTIFGDRSAFAQFEQQALAAAQEMWPGSNAVQLFTSGAAQWPLKDGNAEADKSRANSKDGEHFRGTFVLKARTDFPPDVRGPDKQPVPVGQRAAVVYSGSVGYIHGEVVAYNGVGGGRPGAKIRLQNVMKTADGQRIAGGLSAEEAFAGIAGVPTAANPAATLPEAVAPTALPEVAPAPVAVPAPTPVAAPVPAAPAPVPAVAPAVAPAPVAPAPVAPAPSAAPGQPWF